MHERLKTSRGHEYAKEEKDLDIYAVIKLVTKDLSDTLREAFNSLIVFPREAVIVSHIFEKIHSRKISKEYLEILHERSLLERSGDDFSLHGIIRDVLENDLNSDQKKKFFRQLVEQYENEKFDANDSFFLLHFVSTCLSADRKDVAVRLLSSADYLLCRFFETRFTNLLSDFEAVLSQEPDEAVESFRNFFSDPHLWIQNFARKTLVRQALLLRRGEHVARFYSNFWRMCSFVGGPRDRIGAFVAWPGPPDTGEGLRGSAG